MGGKTEAAESGLATHSDHLCAQGTPPPDSPTAGILASPITDAPALWRPWCPLVAAGTSCRPAERVGKRRL